MRGLVFGSFADASQDVLDLVTIAANKIAAATWQRSGARNEAEARSYWTAALRRRLGTLVARAMARHSLRRVPLIGVPRAVLDARQRRGMPGLGGGALAADNGAAADILHAFYAHQAAEAAGAAA